MRVSIDGLLKESVEEHASPREFMLADGAATLDVETT